MLTKEEITDLSREILEEVSFSLIEEHYDSGRTPVNGIIYLSFLDREFIVQGINFHNFKEKTFFFNNSISSMMLDRLEYLSVQNLSNSMKFVDSVHNMLSFSRFDNNHLSISIGKNHAPYEEQVHFTIRTSFFKQLVKRLEKHLEEKLKEKIKIINEEKEKGKESYLNVLQSF